VFSEKSLTGMFARSRDLHCSKAKAAVFTVSAGITAASINLQKDNQAWLARQAAAPANNLS
jgi:hypothetical protein